MFISVCLVPSKSDSFNRLIQLSVIQWSGGHCISIRRNFRKNRFKLVQNRKSLFTFKLYFNIFFCYIIEFLKLCMLFDTLKKIILQFQFKPLLTKWFFYRILKNFFFLFLKFMLQTKGIDFDKFKAFSLMKQ